MGTTFRFLAVGDEANDVLDWFARLEKPPKRVDFVGHVALWFEDIGVLVKGPTGEVDARRSPIATFFPPVRRRGVLWTAGELHILPTPLRSTFPDLYKISRAFSKWLGCFERVFTRQEGSGAFDYYLEGSLRNLDTSIFALPRAAEALRKGQYFVAEADSHALLDTLSRTLRLRGVVFPSE